MSRPVVLRLVGLAVAGLLAVAGCSSSDSGSGGSTATTDGSSADPTRVIFATDLALGLMNGRFDGPGAPPVDDAYAVALALSHSDALEVVGLVTVHGNSSVVAAETRAAESLVGQVGLPGLPVVEGAAAPLPNPGVEWFDGESLADTCVNDGVEFMADELQRRHATIAAIGPLTDIACLIENFPDAADNVDEIVALLGSRPGTEIELGGTPVPDLNFTSDPVALQIVLDHSEVPFTAMTFEVSSTVDVNLDDFDEAIGDGNEVAQYYRAGSSLNAIQFGTTTFEVFDAHTIWYLLEPDAYTCTDGGYELTVGQPSHEPSPENDDRFAPGLPGRTVKACDAFSASDGADTFRQAVLDGVTSLG